MIKPAHIQRVCAVAVAALALWASAAAAEGRVPLPTPTIVMGEKCVEDTETMRRSHMDLLRHQRDKTLREGIRTTQHSLKECINCHVPADAKPVQENPDHFCRSCHAYAAVKPDCFDCHASTPSQ